MHLQAVSYLGACRGFFLHRADFVCARKIFLPMKGSVRILGGAVRSGVTPGAVRSDVVLPPKTNPLHAPGHICC